MSRNGSRSRRRPRAEDCEVLSATDLRQRVKAGARSHRLADGTRLQLRWLPVKGCWGGQGGVRLLMACPGCSATVRLLRRPPGEGWCCWRCRPVSFPSHRRSGSHWGRPKPPTWHQQQIEADQRRVAALLGLARWPPERLLWNRTDLEALPLEPGAPRLSTHRREALLLRLDALETLRLQAIWAPVPSDSSSAEGFESLVVLAQRLLKATAWATRRPAGDPRVARQKARAASP